MADLMCIYHNQIDLHTIIGFAFLLMGFHFCQGYGCVRRQGLPQNKLFPSLPPSFCCGVVRDHIDYNPLKAYD